MGKNLIDNYSLLHVASGITAYYWNTSLKQWIIMHCLFEMIENTGSGMMFINKFFPHNWPGGKQHSDSIINSIGDIIFGIIGWLIAYYVNKNYGITH